MTRRHYVEIEFFPAGRFVIAGVDLENGENETLANALMREKQGLLMGVEIHSETDLTPDQILSCRHRVQTMDATLAKPIEECNELETSIREIRSIVDFLVSELPTLRPQSDSSSTTDIRETPLSDLEIECLRILVRFDATSAKKRRTSQSLCEGKDGYPGSPEDLKRPLANLSKRGYCGSKKGRDGGSWITPDGGTALDQIEQSQQQI